MHFRAIGMLPIAGLSDILPPSLAALPPNVASQFIRREIRAASKRAACELRAQRQAKAVPATTRGTKTAAMRAEYLRLCEVI